MGKMTRTILRMLPPVVLNAAIRAHLMRRRSLLKALRTPTSIIVYVTSRCNLRCGHCFYWDSLNSGSPELTVQDLDKLAASLAHPVSLSLTGGEPFLRRDLGQLVDCFLAAGKAREVSIASNGFFTRETLLFCEQFLQQNPGIPLAVQISLDGLEPTHDAIRGCPGSFGRAWATLEALWELAGRHQGFSVSAGIAVQRRNLSEMAELIDALGARGAEIRINLIRGESSGTFGVDRESSSQVSPKDGSDIALDVAQMHQLHDLLISKNRLYGFWSKRHQSIYEIGMQVVEHRRKVKDCYAGVIDGVIYANGEVAFCELTKPVANLHDYDFDLERLWRCKEASRMRDKVKSCFCTHGCNLATSLMFEPDMVLEAVQRKLHAHPKGPVK